MRFKTHIAASVSGFALALGAACPAVAQDADQDLTAASVEDEADEVIIVTGSRIPRLDVESTQPVQVIGDEAIDASGVTNIQELLLENPVFGTPAINRTNNAFGTTGTGAATVDLRDLGSNRTLVLINGRRVVAGLAGSSIVDFNVIPTQFIERVDVLTGGASSLYGSDAVAGVVNFVYDDDFEGFKANAQYGITEQGDTPVYQINGTWGTNFDDDRGNVMVHVGYTNEGELLSRERENTAIDDFDNFRVTGDPTQFGIESVPFFSSFPPQGRFDILGTSSGGDDYTFGANGVLQPCFSTNGTPTCTAFDGSPASGPNGFNRQFFRTLAVPVERQLFAATLNYEFSEAVGIFAEATYNKTTSARLIEPFASSSGGTNPLYPDTGRAPIESRVLVDTDNDGIPDSFQVLVNPLVPAEIVAAAQDIDGDGLRDIGFTRRLLELGERRNNTNRDFYRVVVGLEGELLDQFRWDVSYNFGRMSENQRSSGQPNVPNFRNAFAAIADVNDIDGDGNVTEAICANADARAEGCVPISIFGFNSITPEAAAYVAAPGTFQTDIQQQVVQGNISGNLFDIWGGPVGAAVGVEYRREESLSDFDALTNQGLNAGNQIPDTQGEFDVFEIFGEVRIPILSDTPFFHLLEASGAVRYADYSTIGGVTSWNGQLVWAPVEDIRFRGTYSRAVRAPQIGELFAAQSQTFPSGLTDPCTGIGPSGGGTLGDVCRSFPGVNTNIATNGVFTLTQADIQGISGFNGGNPNLNEETADTLTLGVVINPRSIDALRNLTITADYYNIDIEDVIASPPRAFTLDQCFNNGNQAFCSLITRRAQGDSTNSAGSLEFINATLVNGALAQTEGIDVTARYFTSLDGIGINDGRLSANIAYTHVFSNDFIPAAGEPADPAAGEIGTAQDRFTSNLIFDVGAVRLGFTGTYISASTEDDQFCSAFALDVGCFRQSPEFYLDTQLTVSAADEVEFYVGVDNLLDNDAPALLNGTSFNSTGTDTAPDVYDLFGRRYYAGVRITL